MANVEYKGKPASEPKVNVSGIPKSEYDSTAGGGGAPAGGGGGIVGNIKQHWPVYSVVIGVATIAVIIWINWNKGSSTGTASTTGTTGSATTGSYPDQVYGSQLDADFQQMMQLQNQGNALLQTIVNTPAKVVTTGPGATYSGGLPNPEFNLPKGGRLIAIVDNNSTLASLAKYAHWNTNQVFNYGNNSQIFANEGISAGQTTKKIPKGTVIAI